MKMVADPATYSRLDYQSLLGVKSELFLKGMRGIREEETIKFLRHFIFEKEQCHKSDASSYDQFSLPLLSANASSPPARHLTGSGLRPAVSTPSTRK
jgi:hypothetical protein